MGCVCMLGDNDKPTPTWWEETGESVGRRRKEKRKERQFGETSVTPAPEAPGTAASLWGLSLGELGPQQSPREGQPPGCPGDTQKTHSVLSAFTDEGSMEF